jgi:hypothetical protein
MINDEKNKFDFFIYHLNKYLNKNKFQICYSETKVRKPSRFKSIWLYLLVFEDKKKSNSNKSKFRYSEQYNYLRVINTVIANKRLNKVFLEVQVRFLFSLE